jgi:hypothetical protein
MFGERIFKVASSVLVAGVGLVHDMVCAATRWVLNSKTSKGAACSSKVGRKSEFMEI